MKVWRKIPKPLRSFYFLFGAFALIWMLFFDKFSIPSQVRQYNRVARLRADLDYYRAEAEKMRQIDLLLTNEADMLEKLAREEFYMRRPGEDVFVIKQK